LVTERERSIEAGMNGVISKPFEPAALVKSIRSLVPLERPGARAPLVFAKASNSWPEISGIDTSDVRTRLGEDMELFRSLLALMIGEFSHGNLPDEASPRDRLGEFGRRMHRLKGSAGALGAGEIASLASEAERAAREGDVSRAERLAHDLTHQLESLAESARPHLKVAASLPESPGVLNAVLDLDGLLAALRQQNIAAMDRFRDATPPLRRLMPPAEFDALRFHIGNLEFAAAAAILDSVQLVETADSPEGERRDPLSR
jgi:HPt (histidine-containing phosphotransfer) domain-containing protein